MQELEQVASILNQQSDGINELIKGFNDKLRNLNIGIEVWLDDYPLASARESQGEDYGTVIHTDTVLCYAKIGDDWRLAVRNTVYRETADENLELVDSGHHHDLLRADRSTRTKALELIPKLISRLHAEAQSTLSSIEKARKALNSL
jgi:hypothetical protein